jgi:hypothetical protein
VIFFTAARCIPIRRRSAADLPWRWVDGERQFIRFCEEVERQLATVAESTHCPD